MTDKKPMPDLLPYQRLSALTHGHYTNRKGSPTYQSWLAMKSRCKHKSRDKENKYVNRGISVCEHWQDFENFLSDMGERPEGKTLERIDNSKGYSPENCTWATATEQARNRRNKKLEYMDAYTICCRMLSGYTAKSIADEFGCSESLPREILKGRTWKDACKAAYQFMEVKECPVK